MAACNDLEGWSAVSQLRGFDTTPCFEEGILLSSVYAIIFLVGVVRTLSACLSPPMNRTSKSRWLLRGKIFLLVLAFFTSLANLTIILFLHKSVPLLQSYILEPISILGIIFLTYYNHTRARNSSTALLIYWPIDTIIVLIWVRTTVAKDFHLFRLPVALKCTVCVLGLLSFALECIGPEFDQKSDLHESPILTANIFGNWAFSWMTPLMRKGASQYISEADLPNVRPQDECDKLGQRLKDALKKQYET